VSPTPAQQDLENPSRQRVVLTATLVAFPGFGEPGLSGGQGLNHGGYFAGVPERHANYATVQKNYDRNTHFRLG